MGAADIAAILVALIAALGAWAAQRSAAKASKVNTVVSSRLEAERQAYERARAFDVQTINRQNKEIKSLHTENERLRGDLRKIKKRLNKLETLFPQWERLLHERLDEETDDQEQ